LSAVAVSAAVRRPDKAYARRCEIIVKLHPQVMEAQGADRQSRIPQTLESLHGRYHVREARPLIAGGDRQARLQVLRTQGTSPLARREQRLLRRLRQGRAAGETPDLKCIYRIQVDAGAGDRVQDLLDACRRNPDVEYAELSHVLSICVQPDDPEYGKQWGMEKIAAPEAWETCRGSDNIVIAVIDTGVDYNHRDLQGNIWCNEAELNGTPNVDDDGNGYIDDIHGYNFAYNNSDPNDDHGHGTHIAGTIAAIGNNGLDVAGLCWNARIMALKMLDAGGDGSSADAAPAIYYAVANGADVISLSWGSDEDSRVIKDAIAYARRQGVLVVAAAGNDGSRALFYPASYPEVIAVASTESDDRRSLLSNYGDWVDIAAPGSGIVSLAPTDISLAAGRNAFTATLSGTSMATPFVTGACALLLAANPFLTSAEVEKMLLSTGDPIAAGICASNARLNVGRALRAAVPPEGIVRFDQPVYAANDEIEVLLADWDLRDTGLQAVLIVTDGGDSEQVTLAQTGEAKGVFRGIVASERGEAQPDDGRIQAKNGQSIVARYVDAAGQWIEAQALADYEAPALVEQTVQTRGPTARIELTASEPTQVEVRYADTRQGPFTRKVKDAELSERHSLRIAGLMRGTTYYYMLVLVDQAGNETITDDEGRYYSFDIGASSTGFRVPSEYPTIQAAIDDAWTGDTVWVADGTYAGEGNIEIDFGGRAITVRSENGPQSCIIDCRSEGRAFFFQGGEGRDAVMEGFTITHGGGGGDYGGAIRCVASSPTIRNCILVKNNANSYGGGVCNSYGSSPLIENCTFEENSCSSSRLVGLGGGMANMQNSSPIVQDCTFIGNSASSGGGMANVDDSSPRMIRCTFRSNFTARFGGAVGNWDNSHPVFSQCIFAGNSARDSGAGLCNRDKSNVTLTNCVLSGNLADHDGGAMRVVGATVTLANCTVSGNEAGRWYGGVVSTAGGELRLEDCILWANMAERNGPGSMLAQVAADGGEIAMDYCCVQDLAGVPTGVGNIAADPLFVDPNNADYHLRSQGWRWDGVQGRWTYDSETSPCIDAGNPGRALSDEPTAIPDDPNHLLGTNVRIDMGAYGGTPEASMAPPQWALLADVNNDRRVDWLDLAHLTADWATTGESRPGDLSRDGAIGGPDLALLGTQWRHKAGSATTRTVVP
jgi:subtilisin family serine protease